MGKNCIILSDGILKKIIHLILKFIYKTNKNIREIWRHDSFLIRIGSETYDIKANAAERGSRGGSTPEKEEIL